MLNHEIIEADLSNADHQMAVLRMINMYAMDPLGGGKPLPDSVQSELIKGLTAHPTTLVFLAYAGGQPAGIAVCFIGFSTFAAKPLVNIHDLAVAPEFRKMGLGKAILKKVEAKATELKCCKLTLEVLESNRVARNAYYSFGFDQGQCGQGAGGTLFYTKTLPGQEFI